jgi:hypothetical protein
VSRDVLALAWEAGLIAVQAIVTRQQLTSFVDSREHGRRRPQQGTELR